MRIIESAAAAALCVAMSIGAASAAEPNATACRDLESQVRSALEASQAGNREEAIKEQSSGQTYCSHGYYRIGLTHLSQALKLLGSDKT
jgi:hypothetical protein